MTYWMRSIGALETPVGAAVRFPITAQLTAVIAPPPGTGNTTGSVLDSMPQYRYELRQGERVVATGRFERSEPLEIEERIEIGGHAGIVRAVEPILGQPELRLVVQLLLNGRHSTSF